MRDFYADWLTESERVEAALDATPVVARARDLDWIETRQDHLVAMLIGDQVGFPTQGTSLVIAEIPAAAHTGRHAHGEEAIHILSGEGFSVVDGRRYDWEAGATLHVPYMAEHQHFSTGAEPVRYLSASSMDLDFASKLGRLKQLEDKGHNPADLASVQPADGGEFAADGRRIVLHLRDAPNEGDRANGHGAGHGHGGERVGGQAHRHGAIYVLMGGSESPSEENNGFRASAASMTNIFEEVPHTSSHKHSHTEAVLYVLEGTGYSEIDGKRYDWSAGDAVHVPPRMTMHEHFNVSDQRTRTLRIEFGIRYFYEALWSGYAKVEHRLEVAQR